MHHRYRASSYIVHTVILGGGMLEKGYRSRSRRGSGQGEECLMDTRFKRLRITRCIQIVRPNRDNVILTKGDLPIKPSTASHTQPASYAPPSTTASDGSGLRHVSNAVGRSKVVGHQRILVKGLDSEECPMKIKAVGSVCSSEPIAMLEDSPSAKLGSESFVLSTCLAAHDSGMIEWVFRCVFVTTWKDEGQRSACRMAKMDPYSESTDVFDQRRKRCDGECTATSHGEWGSTRCSNQRWQTQE
ncbi:hypothetical protein EDD16DRAFT_1517051 [Pisolithus croceorrhizus]|nr:hypothetical protein EDD16DRAFT_1517051 [Pisolithus croceorrhizus]KAI6128527.1 hypothetical protein EV401DRAFT_1885140 [Pisolithus croceorrhizus]KAI6159387.1 hypothetical protein EDD17DRAFT_1511310 [Pisolithus thermaeus]